MVLTLLLFFIVSNSGVAQAAGDPILFAQPSLLRPGDEITVQGLQFGSKLTVELHLISSQSSIHLGETQSGAAGDFTVQFRLPDTLAEGTYLIQATDTSGKNAFMRLTVSNNLATSSVTQGMNIPARERSVGQNVGFIAFFVVVAAFGLLLAWTTQRKVRRAK
jgi:hypothetical protein